LGGISDVRTRIREQRFHFHKENNMQTLNVILHGLFALVDQGQDYILALAPDVEGQHSFRAGSWLGETVVRRGFYRLEGVLTGKGEFEPSKNLVLRGKLLSATAALEAHATFLFPRPRQIYSLRPVKVSPNDFVGTDAVSVGENHPSTTVLVYDVPTLGAVRLAGHFFTPPKDDRPSYNLHIYSEEDTGLGDAAHPIDAFAKVVSLFLNVDLRLKTPGMKSVMGPPDASLPDAIVPVEIENLSHTVRRLSDTGDLVRAIQNPTRQSFSIDTLRDLWAQRAPQGVEAGTCSQTLFLATVG
jgi:hypothetical protein